MSGSVKSVSRAATELADKLLKDERVHYFSNGQFKYCPSEAAAMIDAALKRTASIYGP